MSEDRLRNVSGDPEVIDIISSITLDEPVCCLACPFHHKDLLVLGAYKLLKDTQIRIGSLQVMKVHNDSI